jgi:hypothetical protein
MRDSYGDNPNLCVEGGVQRDAYRVVIFQMKLDMRAGVALGISVS